MVLPEKRMQKGKLTLFGVFFMNKSMFKKEKKRKEKNRHVTFKDHTRSLLSNVPSMHRIE